jgi:hypothetical protein
MEQGGNRVLKKLIDLDDRWTKRQLWKFLRHAYLTYDFNRYKKGSWQFFFRTPLFGLALHWNYPSFDRPQCSSGVGVFVIPNLPHREFAILYRHNKWYRWGFNQCS